MSPLPSLLAAVSALLAGLGVALAAAGAHLPNGGALTRTASIFLLLHAVAGVGISSHARIACHANALVLLSFALLAGAALFAADLAVKDFSSERLFLYAAPIGGTIMVVTWAALALAFAIEAVRKR